MNNKVHRQRVVCKWCLNTDSIYGKYQVPGFEVLDSSRDIQRKPFIPKAVWRTCEVP